MKNELLTHTYIKSNVTKKWLIDNGFQFNKLLSSENEIYTYRFTVYKYKKYSILTCELSIDLSSGNVGIDLYDEKWESYYPFYYITYGNYDPLLNPIYEKIKNKLKEFNIKRITSSCK
ncbi:hypothetical protein C824_001377 [Schaedlerella arabinosiphila]|nr:hypothetical protein C824_001377 [Schaedlerella arabinosiphila]